LCWSSATDIARAQSANAAAAAANDPGYRALFQRMYNNPQDMETTFKFAEVATRLGDYEAAIGALERVLLYNPNLARVKVELAALYQRIGGTQVAESYIDQALTTPGVTEDVRVAAQQLLTTGPVSAEGPNKFTVFLNAGLRYQSNASAGPTSNSIRSFGDVTSLDRRFAAQPDWNSFVLANLGYSHDMGPGIAFETTFFGYYAKQFDLSLFDTGLVEVLAGPRFTIPSALVRDLSIKPYAIGTKAWLADDPYYSGGGVGISSRFTLGDVARLEPAYELRDRNFTNSEFYPTVSEQTGHIHVAMLTGDGKLFGMAWAGRLAGGWNRSDHDIFAFNSYDRITGDIGFPMPFTLTFWDRPHQFVFTPTAGFSVTDFLQPNPAVDRNVAREDKEWRVGAALDIQVYQQWGVRTHVQYTEVLSNLPNFDMKNFAVSVGPTYRF
jgi:hypothetical protein